MRRLIVLALVCAAPGALRAQTAAPVPAPQAAADAQPVKKTCRREETTGSIMAKRVCHTKEEWAEIRAANERAAEQFGAQRRAGMGSPGQ